MTAIPTMYGHAELALAAYSTLTPGATGTQSNIDALVDQGNGLALRQAQEFALRYPQVIAQINDAVSGFVMTAFRDASGAIALAIRGTCRKASSNWRRGTT